MNREEAIAARVARRTLAACVEAIKGADDGLRARIYKLCRLAPGPCWCGIHTSSLDAGDRDQDEWLSLCAESCNCCSLCSDVPCAGVMQGGPCDRMPCSCFADEDTTNDR